MHTRYFNRDVECIRTFFRRKFQYDSTLYPRFRKVFPEERDGETFRLDVVVSASGFVRNEMKELEEVGTSHFFGIVRFINRIFSICMLLGLLGLPRST